MKEGYQKLFDFTVRRRRLQHSVCLASIDQDMLFEGSAEPGHAPLARIRCSLIHLLKTGQHSLSNQPLDPAYATRRGRSEQQHRGSLKTLFRLALKALAICTKKDIRE